MIVSLGDLLLDVIVRLRQPLAEGADADAITRLGPGGQAANVAAWVAELGGQARFVGKRADDEAGGIAARGLERYGVDVRGPVVDGRTGTVVSLVAEDGARTMATDRGVSPEFRVDELDPAWLDGCTHLHLPGYSLLRSPIDEVALQAAELAPRVSVDLSSWSAIRDFGPGALSRAARGAAAGDRVRKRGRGADPRRPAGGLRVGAEARFARRELRGQGAPRRARRRSRHDGRRRCARRRLSRRRAGAGARRRGEVRRETRLDAVKDLFKVSDEVDQALAERRAVVALETTLVAHGFPPGEGIEVGLESERRVREAGGIPATIGVLDGVLRVGLTADELARFTADARKVGPRDLAAALVQGVVGATTVGGTLAACRVVGIGFMGTGGLGGVHRGFPDPPDISADLGELIRTEALIVSSGVKSILDVPATAELLETLGVPVLGYRTDDLPLFYKAHGGPAVSARVESAEEAARIARAHWRLGRHTSILLGRPATDSLDDVEPLIEQALAEAHEQGIMGQAVTPFVLSYLHRESGGRTLAANRDLIADNAGLAAEVAVAYASL